MLHRRLDRLEGHGALDASGFPPCVLCNNGENKRLVMPLLDSSDRLSVHARDLFRIEPKSPEMAVGELLRSGDSWITMCAIATAAEMNLQGLAKDIAKAAEHAGQETVAVARAAAAALA